MIRTFLWQTDTQKNSMIRYVTIWEWDEKEGPIVRLPRTAFSYQDPIRFVKNWLAERDFISPPVHKPSGASVFEDQEEARYFEL